MRRHSDTISEKFLVILAADFMHALRNGTPQTWGYFLQ
jgi:hypothetical protein